jgi:hypothetical protein
MNQKIRVKIRLHLNKIQLALCNDYEVSTVSKCTRGED